MSNGTTMGQAITQAIQSLNTKVDAAAAAVIQTYWQQIAAAIVANTVTNWVAYTPTGTWVSNATYAGLWRRVGDSMEIQIQVTCTGAPTATNLHFNIPTGYTIDTTKLLNTTSGDNPLGLGQALVAAVGSVPAVIMFNDTASVTTRYVGNSASNISLYASITATLPGTFASGDIVMARFSVPITQFA